MSELEASFKKARSLSKLSSMPVSASMCSPCIRARSSRQCVSRRSLGGIAAHRAPGIRRLARSHLPCALCIWSARWRERANRKLARKRPGLWTSMALPLGAQTGSAGPRAPWCALGMVSLAAHPAALPVLSNAREAALPSLYETSEKASLPRSIRLH